MSDARSATATVSSLNIEGELTIYRAAEVCATLKAALAGGGDLEVNLKDVTELDSAGVQLLIVARRAARDAQCTLRLVGHSAAVLDVFEILGLEPDLAEAVR